MRLPSATSPASAITLRPGAGEFFGRARSSSALKIDDGHGCAVFGQPFDDRPANTLSSAGDDGHLALQIDLHRATVFVAMGRRFDVMP